MKSSRAKRRELERKYKKDGAKANFIDNEVAYKMRYQLTDTQRDVLFKKLSAKDTRTVEGVPFPRTLEELRSIELSHYSNEIRKEINWISYCIKKYSNKIQRFIELEKEFEYCFLLGNYSDAKEVLQRVDDEICISQWSLEKRMLLAEYQEGFLRHKEIYSSILTGTSDSFVRIMAIYQSLRIEKKLSAHKFDQSLESYLSNYDFGLGKEYLKFKLLPFTGFPLSEPRYILWVESTSSIIDRYQTFIKISQHIICSETHYSMRDVLGEHVSEINKKIIDVRLANIYLSLEGEVGAVSTELFDNEISNILDEYTRGNYKTTADLVRACLIEKPWVFELYTIYAKASIASSQEFVNFLPKDSLSNKILNNIWHITVKDEYSKESLIHLHKSVYSLGWSTLSTRASWFISNEYSIHDDSFKAGLFSFLNTSFVNPMISLYTGSYSRGLSLLKRYNKQLNYKTPTSVLMQIILDEVNSKPSTVSNDDLNLVSKLRLNMYKAYSAQIKKKYSEAFSLYSEVAFDDANANLISLPPWIEEINHGMYTCLIGLQEFREAINLATKTIISNSNFLQKFSNLGLVEKIISGQLNDIQNQIQVPIFLHLFQASTTDIYVAYDDFMYTQGLNYPHELIHTGRLYDEEFIYFLRYICTQEIFSSSGHFTSQDELDNERIEICLKLAEIDKKDYKIHIQEASDIARNISIRKGVRQVDESKIYVDIKGIKNVLDKDLRESFYRYIELLSISNSKLEELNVDENEVIPFLNQNKTSSKENIENDLRSNIHSRFKLFVNLFIRVRNAFIASNEFGLDTYLSTRIRHGTLLGHIRSVFERHNLVTIKDSNTGEYVHNQFWLDALSITNEDKAASFNAIMSALSHSVDFISQELKNKYLQINTETHQSQGLFEYIYYLLELSIMFRDTFNEINDYDTFIDTIIEELWARTEHNLEEVRALIMGNIKDDITQSMRDASEALALLLNRSDNPAITNLTQAMVKCETDITIELETIAQWFKRTSSQNIDVFDMELVLDTTIQIIKRIHPLFNSFSPIIRNLSSKKFEGEYFIQFTDITQIIIDNLVKHSLLEQELLSADITISDEGDNLIILAKNNLSPLKDLDEIKENINDINQFFAHSKSDDAIRKEKRSGYRKLKKILYNDLGCKYVLLELLLDEDESQASFEISLTFDIQRLIKSS